MTTLSAYLAGLSAGVVSFNTRVGAITLTYSDVSGVLVGNPVVASVADGSTVALLEGSTVALRVNVASTGVSLDATDQTGAAAYKPLFIGGTSVGIRIYGTQAGIINGNSNFCWGTTTDAPITNIGAAKFNVVSGADGASIVGSAGSNTLNLGKNGTPSGTWISFMSVAGTNYGNITVNGSGTAYNTTSDYRLKDIDGPVTDSGAFIDLLRPVQGRWKEDGSRFIGLIAHEAQAVAQTQIVTGEKDGDEMQTMDYSAAEIIANLIAEVQSLRTRMAELEAA